MPKKYGTPGPRAIHPEICTSRPLAACEPVAQLLFERLIAQADDQGRLQGDPVLVAARCMPLVEKATRAAVDGWLGQLEAQRLLIRYEADGEPLIQIRGWWDSQDWMRRAYRSRWAAPTDWVDQVWEKKSEAGLGRGEAPQVAADRGGTALSASGGASAMTSGGASGDEPPPMEELHADYLAASGVDPGTNQKVGGWLQSLVRDYGIVRVMAALRGEAPRGRKGLLERMQAGLEGGGTL